MKKIFHNPDNLTEEDITVKAIRTKLLLINSNNEILLGYCHKTYQFPGGHLDEGETLIDCLNREIKEETGIELNIVEIEPFFFRKHYSKDWPSVGQNKCADIYYYVIKTDEKYHLNNTNYDEYEKKNNYELRYIKLDEVEKVLTDSIPDDSRNVGIVKEMLEVIKEYKNMSK